MNSKNRFCTLLLVSLVGLAGCSLKQTSEPESVNNNLSSSLKPADPAMQLRPAQKSTHKDKIAETESDLADSGGRSAVSDSSLASQAAPSSRPTLPPVASNKPIAPATKPHSAVAGNVMSFAAPPVHEKKMAAKRKRMSTGASLPRPLVRMLPNTERPERENYQHYSDNPIKLASEDPVSTFSIDVDTGSYTNARRILKEGRLPVTDAVRAEEFINYFNYDYPLPDDKAFAFSTEIGPSPWNHNAYLLHIGIQGKRIAPENLPPSNLVFLVDVSGSMQSADKLSLLIKGLKLLTRQLRPQDRVALAVYAGSSGLVLDSTSGAEKNKIMMALDQLRAGGSTNGGSGIRLAYQTARSAFIKNGSNRIILATDGDFNVGTVNFNALLDLVKRERQSGIELTTLGFGSGNYNDKLLEQLADAGNGNYAYIDSLLEAQKALVEQLGGTLHTIAKDVKIQIEFNPDVISEYRLIGYENRKLRREDFNNDKIDAGEIGAGHSVTALYEIVLSGSEGARIDPLRYGGESKKAQEKNSNELAFLKLRYKAPKSDSSQLVTMPLAVSSIQRQLDKTSNNFRFAASVAAFAQMLRGGKYIGESSDGFHLQHIIKLAQQAKGKDENGYRSEYIRLLKLSQALMTPVAGLQR